MAGLIEEYQNQIREEIERNKRMASVLGAGVFPGALPPLQPPGITGHQGAHQHSLDAAMYAARAMQSQRTPKQLAMMGEYNQRSPDENFFIKLLGMRLRVKEGEQIPFDYIGCHHDMASGDVHLMIVRNNTAVTFQESGAIFPSDETIAQLNMIINK